MPKITMEGAEHYDGEYVLDNTEQNYNGDELHLIKRVSGIRLGELEEAAEAEDYDLMIALAVIALLRDKKVRPQDEMLAVKTLRSRPLGVIRFDITDEEAAAVLALEEQEVVSLPPEKTSADGEPPGEPESETSSEPSSTTSSDTGDDPPEMLRLATGEPG